MNQYKVILFISLLFVICFADKYSAQTANAQKAGIQSEANSSQQILADDSLTINSVPIETKYNSIQYDSSNIIVRSMDSTKIKSYLKDKDFRYFEDPESTMTLWERLMEWLKRQFLKLTEYDSYNTAWDIFIYLLIALAVVAIVFGIYKSEIKGLFLSNKNKNKLNVSESFRRHSLN